MCHSGKVSISPNLKDLVIAGPEMSLLRQYVGTRKRQIGTLKTLETEEFLRRKLRRVSLILKVFGNGDPEGFIFCQFGTALLLQSERISKSPIRKSPYFANPEGSLFRQSGRVSKTPTQKIPTLLARNGLGYGYPEGSLFRRFKRASKLSKKEGSPFRQS